MLRVGDSVEVVLNKEGGVFGDVGTIDEIMRVGEHNVKVFILRLSEYRFFNIYSLRKIYSKEKKEELVSRYTKEKQKFLKITKGRCLSLEQKEIALGYLSLLNYHVMLHINLTTHPKE